MKNYTPMNEFVTDTMAVVLRLEKRRMGKMAKSLFENALIEKLGILEATRFLALKFESELDSVKWHQEWQAQLDKDAFFDDVFK